MRRGGLVRSDCASLDDGLVISLRTDARSDWRLDGHLFKNHPRRRVWAPMIAAIFAFLLADGLVSLGGCKIRRTSGWASFCSQKPLPRNGFHNALRLRGFMS